MVKIIMRPRARSILAAHPAVHGTVSGCHPRLLVWVGEKAGRCPSPGDCAPDGTSSQLNTHNTKLREVCYPWHPWYGHSVVIHDAFVRHGQAVLRCTLDHKERSRALDIPQWMFDRAPCCLMHVAEAPRVSWEALRECQELLHHQSPTGQANVLQDQHRSSPAQGDADAKSTQSSLCSVGVIATAWSAAHLADSAPGYPPGHHKSSGTSAAPGPERAHRQRSGGGR